MQTRVSSLEQGKETVNNLPKTTQVRGLPWRLLLIFALFLGVVLVISFISIFSVRRFGLSDIVAIAKPDFFPCADTLISDHPNKKTDLEDWIKPPSVLMHKMTDEELFWRATFVPRIRKFPFSRTPKMAFMFLTKGPLPLAPLWERFFKGNEGWYSIYIHSLPTYQEDFPSTSVFYKRNIPSKVATWGRMSMCDAERRLLANALLDLSNEWFILLSESCIPLFNFSSIYSYISRSRHSFMGAFDDHGPFGRGRYNENMAPLVNISQWRKGAQWFEINRKLAISIVEDSTFYPKFRDFCRPSCYVDEHYFPTMLHILASNQIANRSLTWVDWSRGGPHPATFGKADIKPEFFKKVLDAKKCVYNDQPGSVCFLFARKFSPSTLEPLLALSEEILHF